VRPTSRLLLTYPLGVGQFILLTYVAGIFGAVLGVIVVLGWIYWCSLGFYSTERRP